MRRPPPRSTLFPYTTLFRSRRHSCERQARHVVRGELQHLENDRLRGGEFLLSHEDQGLGVQHAGVAGRRGFQDRKSTRLNSSHMSISYAVFCLKKKIIPDRL